MKYVVAKGCSFVGDKKTYNEGDEIDEKVFSKKERFESFLKGDNPKIIPAPSVKDDEDLTGVDLTGVDVPTREEIEKLILEKGLLKEDKIKVFKDVDLLKFAVKKGLIKK